MSVSVIPKKRMPPLSENSFLRYFTFILLYFSQGIPEGLTIFAIPAWLAMHGKSAVEIGSYSAVVIIPFSLKIILAPLMERYTYLPMGRRRPWLLFGQLGILCSLLALSCVPHPLENIFLLTVVALCAHIFIMFQDIATDSLVIDIVPIEQQGKANSFMWGAKTIGTSISLFAGSWLINRYGFSTAVVTLSGTIFLVMFVPLLLRERRGEKLLPWMKGATSPDAARMVVTSWGKLFKSVKQVMVLRNTLLLLATVFSCMAAIHFLRTLLPIFLIQERGWDNVFYSKIFSSSNLAGGVIGMLVGGLIIQRFGAVRLIQASLLLIALLVITLAASESLLSNSDFLCVFIVLFCIFVTLIYIGVLALAMNLCWRRVSAIQFTFYMTIFNAGLATGASLVGILRPYLTWQLLFVAFTLLIFVAMFILKFIKPDKHREQVELLEKNYVAVLEEEGTLLVNSETS